MPTEVELAYLAGIIDGEGCIGASGLRDRRQGRAASVMFTVHITMTDREAIDLAKKLYGGCVRKRKIDRRGGRRPLFCWQAYGDIGARFLRDISPYLRVKQRQALVYLAARQTFTGGPRKGVSGVTKPSRKDIEIRFECLKTIQALNQRQPSCQ